MISQARVSLASILGLALGLLHPAYSAPEGELQAAARTSESQAFRRFALVVGANDGGSRRLKLRYAGSDAANFAGVLTELGGVRKTDLKILQGPTRNQLLQAMKEMQDRIDEAGGASGRLELLVYYSGHSDESGLLLGEEKVRYSEFRSRIDSTRAKIRLAIVDACASGALIRLKGGSRLPAFAVDQSSSLRGYAFLTSSSGNESAQESDRIRASFFTHYLVTGLRGAADLNLDGKVTLGEAYEFAFHETLSQTEGSQAGAQHPSYDMRLTGTGDLVLTDLRGTSAGLVLDKSLQGRVFVRSASGALVVELQKQPGRKVELGLEPGLYDVRLDRGDAFFRTLVKVDSLSHHPVVPSDFEPAAREKTRERGGEAQGGSSGPGRAQEPETAAADPADSWIPARAALIPALGFPGYGAGPFSHNLSLNLFVGQAKVIHGLQFSLLVNQSEQELHGLQLALAFNRSRGASRGLQLASLANMSWGMHQGLQLGLAANYAERFQGMQWAAINSAGRGAGLQAGLINAAIRGSGAQVGILNAAGRFRGLQLGLVNIARENHGAVIGPLNIIGNGLHDVEAYTDEKSMLHATVLLGGKYNYTWYSFDMKARYPRHLWGGSAGLGLHIPSGPLYTDLDFGPGILWNEKAWENFSVTGRLRWLVGYQPMRYFSVFGGFTYNLEAWPGSQRPNLNPGKDGESWGEDIRAERWPGFIFGVRL